MSEELKKLKKDLAIDEYLELIKEDNLLNNSYISLAQYMYFLEKQLQQAEEVIEEIKKYIEDHSIDTYEREYSMFEKCIPLDLLDILNKYKKKRRVNKMSAKEMFEELDYEYYEDDGFTCYKRKTKVLIEPDYISFNRLEREIFLSRKNENGITIDTCILQAINKQVDELGWK